VLLVHSSSGRYGADRQLSLIARGLDPRRYRPHVVLPAAGPLAEELSAAGVPVTIRPLAVVRRELMRPAGLARLAAALAADAATLGRLARSHEAALVHSNTSVVLGGAAAARRAGIPHVWHVREIYSRFGRIWPAHRRLLLSAAALPCVSHATAAQFAGADAARVLYDGLPVAPGRAPRGEARAALELPDGAPVVAVLGRISDWKGQDVLVRALATPALASVGAIGLLAGDPWPGAEARLESVRALAAELGVTGRLRILGFRPDVENVLGAADVVAVPSTAPDPLPNSALEAAAAGCPVVAADHGGLPEIVRDGISGRLVTPGDAEALAGAVRSLIDDPAEARRLGAAAAEDVRVRFAPERLLAELQLLYDELSR
jgi:glycosyltransferase involved in cell wall biosynthesis